MARPLPLLAVLALLAPAPAAQVVISEFSVRSPNSQSGGYFGREIAAAGDLDGDGAGDFFVGVEAENGTRGRVYAFSGADGAVLLTVEAPTTEQAYFGYFVEGAGDRDGDGTPDVFTSDLSTVGGLAFAGRVYLVSGADGSTLRTFTSPAPEASGYFGYNVAATGDLDGDGTDDLVVGAGDEDVTENGTTYVDRGRIYALSGADGAVLWSATTPTPDERTYLGRVVTAGDVTGDGVPDLLASAVRASDSDGVESGLAYVFSGADGALVYTFESENAQANGLFGHTLRGLPDITGDGVPDLAVGAPYEGVGGTQVRDGTVAFFSGADGARLGTYAEDERQAERLYGWEIEPLGDLDGDGVTEIGISAYAQLNAYDYLPPPNSTPFSGALFVISGADVGGEAPDFAEVYPSLPDLPTSYYWGYGTDFVAIGDTDGDGFSEVAVGAPTQGVEIGFTAVLGGASIVALSDANTAEEAAVAVPPGGGTYDFGPTGVDLVLGNVRQRAPADGAAGAAAQVTVTRYANGPASTEGIAEANVAGYRWVAASRGPFRLTTADNEIRFTLSETPGAAIADPSAVVVYHRPYVGGTFEALPTTVDAATGEVVGTGFRSLGEFVLASDAGALPTDGAADGALALAASPNPAHGAATVTVTMPAPGPAEVAVFDALGRRVARLWDGPLAAGPHRLALDAGALPAGVYLVRAVTPAGVAGRAVTVVR